MTETTRNSEPSDLGGTLHKVKNEFTQRSTLEADIDGQLKRQFVDLLR